jgi:predicted metal-dependent HD superfamily phosphohydrolase
MPRAVYTLAVFEARHAPEGVAPEIRQVLVARYSEPHRAYHDLAHIAELLRWFDVVGDAVGWDAPRDVYLAILFHDAIYDPRARDNEARSAELALAHGATPRAAELIRLTARHGALGQADVDRDAAHFLDADTAILGAEPAAFDAYDAAIAVEYASELPGEQVPSGHAHVPPDAYRAGRRAFLEQMARRPRLFLSDFFHARLDAAARANLARALARLA